MHACVSGTQGDYDYSLLMELTGWLVDCAAPGSERTELDRTLGRLHVKVPLLLPCTW
jgi:hypothetical protein